MHEEVAASQLRTANFEGAIAVFMLDCKISALTLVANSTFRNGMVETFTVVILLSSAIAFGSQHLLVKISQEIKGRLRMAMPATGCLLGATGLISFVILRAQAFTTSLTSCHLDMGQINTGNMLSVAGGTLGVTLAVGVLFDRAVERSATWP
jgi:hypothetical protein